MATIHKYLVNSRTPTDMVVYSHEGEYQGSYGTLNITLSHGLPFIPLAFGIYSIDGGTTWNEIDTENGNAFGGAITATASALRVYISLDTTSTVTFKIRLFAFAPANVYAIITSPVPLSNFYIDTRKYYDQLILTGDYQASFSDYAQTIVNHNLGYLPRAMLWAENIDEQGNTTITKMSIGSIGSMWGYRWAEVPIINAASLQILCYNNVPGTAPPRIHYRLYRGSNG